MAHKLYTLVETELYTWMLSRLAPIRGIDDILIDLTWAVALLADDLPFVEGSRQIRQILSKPLLQDDGTVVRLVIRFLIRDPDQVELLTVEAVQDQEQ
jgi:hypothetical protein